MSLGDITLIDDVIFNNKNCRKDSEIKAKHKNTSINIIKCNKRK